MYLQAHPLPERTPEQKSEKVVSLLLTVFLTIGPAFPMCAENGSVKKKKRKEKTQTCSLLLTGKLYISQRGGVVLFRASSRGK